MRENGKGSGARRAVRHRRAFEPTDCAVAGRSRAAPGYLISELRFSSVAELGHDVTGVDVSTRMLDRARTEAHRRGVTIRWHHGDDHDRPAVDYDLVTCPYVLWTLPAPEVELAAWARALRPDGAVLIADGLSHTARQLVRRPRLILPYNKANLRTSRHRQTLARALAAVTCG